MMLRRWLMGITDVGLLSYWFVSALVAASLISLPPDWLFKDYHDPRVMAWNWSFLPLDVLLSLTGLYALDLERKQDPRWRNWSLVSLSLTICAGLMAISYWALMRDFDITWWAPNGFLMIWPIPFVVKLACAPST